MQSVPEPILKFARVKSVRVLRPLEYRAIANPRTDILLYTGMRYVEAQRLHDNPEWYKPGLRQIHLPPTAILKEKRRQLDRWIRLNPPGVQAVETYLRGKKLPTDNAFGMAVRKWGAQAGLETEGLGPKTFRKTWESWLVCVYPERSLQIAQNQGHTTATSLMYYLNMPFSEEEKSQMKPFVDGMF